MRPSTRFIPLIFFTCILLAAPAVWAHSLTIDDPFSMTLTDTETIGHEDENPWKGTLTISVNNAGPDPWGDFHFAIADPATGVVFTDEVANTMFGVNDYTALITDDGLNLDFTFYNDPVYQDDLVQFTIHTDNTATQSSFFISS